MENNKPLEVSDWSQKYKLAAYALAIAGFALFVWLAVLPWANEVLSLLREIASKTQ